MCVRVVAPRTPQTSLDQFQTLFDKSMDVAEKASLPSKRVNNIVEAMTYLVYRYINRGLYERDKVRCLLSPLAS
jgi:dynein heavy chain